MRLKWLLSGLLALIPAACDDDTSDIAAHVLVVAPDQLAAVQADLARLQLTHWQIGEVVTATGGERVRIG